mgnify:CR=1 FL=1
MLPQFEKVGGHNRSNKEKTGENSEIRRNSRFKKGINNQIVKKRNRLSPKGRFDDLLRQPHMHPKIACP